MSKVSKGNYYKRKTKQWFIDKGYNCDYLEKSQRFIDKKTNKTIFVKRDMFGADLIAFNSSEFILANSKFGRKNIAKGLKEFAKYKFPPIVKCWLVVWEKGDSEPEIIEKEWEQDIVDLGE